MKGKSTHLVNVPEASTSSTDSHPDYFNEHGDPVYAHMVNVKEINRKKHLIQFPISVDFKESEELVYGNNMAVEVLGKFHAFLRKAGFTGKCFM